MKQIAIILVLIVTGRKSETKTENEIDKSVYDMWRSYTDAKPGFKRREMPESWYFHMNEKEANRLAVLTVHGQKKASSSLYALYEKYGVDLSKVDTKHISTDFNGKAQAIIEIKAVGTIPSVKISKAYAEMDMGTTIETLKKWKKAHWDFFTSLLEENGDQPTEGMLFVCESFETIWK